MGLGQPGYPAQRRNETELAFGEAWNWLSAQVGGFDPADVGVILMRKAFNPQNGPFTNMDISEAERESLANLFVDAIGSYKSPHSHCTVEITDTVSSNLLIGSYAPAISSSISI